MSLKLAKKTRKRIYRYSLAVAIFGVSFVWGTVSFHYFMFTEDSGDSMVGKIIAPVFPIGVNPDIKEIAENNDVDLFYREYVYAGGPELSVRKEWIWKVVDKVALMPWYQNLASASSRTLVIYAGERKEQIAYNFSRILKWTAVEKNHFLNIIEEDNPSIADGKFYPGRYVVSKNVSPTEVAELVYGRFNREILSRYTSDIEKVVPIQDALAVASLLEREAYDFNDMRYISGVIWNRLFIDMRLQIDATLQYARASEYGGKWWPVPRPSDKAINSAFNTYKHEGLPPHPISNPSSEAVLAALNPRKTECLYYFHDKNSMFHCSETYEEHEALIEEYY